MEATRLRVCEFATRLLGPGKLRMQGEGEYYWIADAGGETHLGWHLPVAAAKLRAMAGPEEPSACDTHPRLDF
jgi:hypothetical protein